MKNIEKYVSYDYGLFIELANDCGYSSVTGLLRSDTVIYYDETLDGLLCGVGMDQKELEKMLYSGADTLGYSMWSLYYLKKHDQYILLNNFN